jgi:uncharacterized protein (TIGR02453 family)
MSYGGVPKETVRFLAGLAKNNDKTWFDAHRADYDAYYVDAGRALVEALGPRLKKIDGAVHAEPKTGGSMMRIYRDTRFAKDKRPYKDHLDLWFWSGKKKGWDSSGFYLRLTPKTLMLGAGMHMFAPPVLATYRKAASRDRDGAALAKIVGQLRAAGYEVGGETYKKTPRGVPDAHPRAALLKHSGLYVGWEAKHPRELGSAKLLDLIAKHYAKMAPLHRWLVAMK